MRLKPLSRNPVDMVWGRNRPKPPQGAVIPQPIELAGQTAADKILAIQKILRDDGQQAVVLTLPDSIAWTFNIRGADVAHNPVPLAFAIVPAKGKPELFIDPAKIGANVKGHVAAAARVMPPDQLAKRLADLKKAGKPVRLDPARSAYWFKTRLGTKLVAPAADPCIAPKAIKNAAEIAGTRAAHERDGAAMVRFLAWLEGAAKEGTLDEITAVRQLEQEP